MNLTRVHGRGQREVIGVALDIIGPRICERLSHVQFVAGVDPVFVGLHGYEDTADGRSYRETACCLYPFHVSGPTDRRVTTVVLPKVESLRTVVHELGHALHETIGFDHVADPVTAYARTDNWEAFAEAFTASHFHAYGDERIFGEDRATRALFDRLAA